MKNRTSYQVLITIVFALVAGCGNVTAIPGDGGGLTGQGGQAGESVKLPGLGGSGGIQTTSETGGNIITGTGGEGSSIGTGGIAPGTGGNVPGTGGEGSSPGTGGQTTIDGGSDAISTTGLTGNYFASARGAAYITRVDSIVNFDPGPANFEPEEITWTGQIETDRTISVEIQANDTDTVSLTIAGQATSPGATGLTGLTTNGQLAIFGGWQTISIDIKRDMTMPFKAILERQLVSGTPLTPVPTEVLRPE